MEGIDIFNYFKFKLEGIPINYREYGYLTEGTIQELKFRIEFSVVNLTEDNSNFICKIFTYSDKWLCKSAVDKFGFDSYVLNPKKYIDYLFFKYDNLTNEYQFTVEIIVNNLIQHVRDEKLDLILGI